MRRAMLAVLCAAAFPLCGAALAASGSYTSEAAGPKLQSRSIWYTSVFPVVGDAPRTGRIQSVSWQWGVSAMPAEGLEVKLCYRGAQDCVDVTQFGRGRTAAFAGRPADGRFQLMIRVPGQGRMMPVYGGANQVTVEFTY